MMATTAMLQRRCLATKRASSGTISMRDGRTRHGELWILLVEILLLARSAEAAAAAAAFVVSTTAPASTGSLVGGRAAPFVAQGERIRKSATGGSLRWGRLLVPPLRKSQSDEDEGDSSTPESTVVSRRRRKRVTIVGAGWAGLSAAHALLLSEGQEVEVTLVEESPRVGGLVRDGFSSVNASAAPPSSTSNLSPTPSRRRGGLLAAEAGQHGFWHNYRNIFRLLRELNPTDPHLDTLLTPMAPQGQYSPRGLEAVWPVYQSKEPPLPTGLAQLLYTDFVSLPLQDRVSALPLALAFADLDASDPHSYRTYDSTSFYDLCRQYGVSERCYREAFEPMILTGLFAPGRECSAAAALGMAHFFVMRSQSAFDVRWCRGNVGQRIFAPWIRQMQQQGLKVELSTRVEQLEVVNDTITSVKCRRNDGSAIDIPTDHVILAVSAKALNSIAKTSLHLAASYLEFRGFANLRGTSVVATRICLDKNLTVKYSANACWGFHRDTGMTMFDLRALHGPDYPPADPSVGAVLEVDYYYANSLLALSDDDLIRLVKRDVDNLLGTKCEQATVVDAAVVRLPNAVNWYYPGSYQYLPGLRSEAIRNLCYAGDVVKTHHPSWSQEKAFVTGIQAANLVMGRPVDRGVLPVDDDEVHVQLGRAGVRWAQALLACTK